MFYDEFVDLCEEVTSEMFFAIFDALYQCVPCMQNFCRMRHIFLETLKSKQADTFEEPEYITLPMPVSTKLLARLF